MVLEYPYYAGGEPLISNKTYQYMVNLNKRRCVQKGETFLFEGDIATHAHLIDSGWVAYYLTTEQGITRIISIVGPKRAIAVGPCLDGLPISASVKALSDCEFLIITREELVEAMRNDVDLGIQMVKDVNYRCRSLIEALRNYSSVKSPEERLMNLFQALLYPGDIIEQDGWVQLPIDLTHEVIAEIIDVSRVTVSRLLAEYGKRGLIKKSRRYLLRTELFE